MTVVVTENCQRCRYTDCVTVCPVPCFHGDEEMLYIHPDVCIECGACIPICPVHAIYEDFELPSDKEKWIEINAERATELPLVEEKQNSYPGADERKVELGF